MPMKPPTRQADSIMYAVNKNDRRNCMSTRQARQVRDATQQFADAPQQRQSVMAAPQILVHYHDLFEKLIDRSTQAARCPQGFCVATLGDGVFHQTAQIVEDTVQSNLGLLG